MDLILIMLIIAGITFVAALFSCLSGNNEDPAIAKARSLGWTGATAAEPAGMGNVALPCRSPREFTVRLHEAC